MKARSQIKALVCFVAVYAFSLSVSGAENSNFESLIRTASRELVSKYGPVQFQEATPYFNQFGDVSAYAFQFTASKYDTWVTAIVRADGTVATTHSGQAPSSDFVSLENAHQNASAITDNFEPSPYSFFWINNQVYAGYLPLPRGYIAPSGGSGIHPDTLRPSPGLVEDAPVLVNMNPAEPNLDNLVQLTLPPADVSREKVKSATIQEVVSDSYEGDNSAGYARTIAKGETQTRSIYPNGDVDWITFSVPKATSLILRANTSSVRLSLFGPNSPSRSIYPPSGSTGSELVFKWNNGSKLTPGTYYVKVAGTSSYTKVNYSLTLLMYEFGDKVGEFSGVSVYSNGYNIYDSGQRHDTGLKWQCVEFTSRYYKSVYGISVPSMNANQYYNWAKNTSSLVSVFDNRYSTTPPKPGDILCSNSSTYGHVALVRAVGSNYVDIVQQNYFNTPEDNTYRLTLTSSYGKYTVGSIGNSTRYEWKGWLRAKQTSQGWALGTWRLFYSWACTGLYTEVTWQVNADGTFTDSLGNYGRWVSSGNGITLTYTSSGCAVYNGVFLSGEQKMTGTMSGCSSPGCWYAVR